METYKTMHYDLRTKELLFLIILIESTIQIYRKYSDIHCLRISFIVFKIKQQILQ